MGKFIKDVSVLDGTQFDAGAKFVKTWRVRNDGPSAWPDQTFLTYVGGDQLGDVAAVAVPQVPSTEEVEISVPMTAPSLPGRYNSFWRLCGPDGIRFGHRVWVEIIVPPPVVLAASNGEKPNISDSNSQISDTSSQISDSMSQISDTSSQISDISTSSQISNSSKHSRSDKRKSEKESDKKPDRESDRKSDKKSDRSHKHTDKPAHSDKTTDKHTDKTPEKSDKNTKQIDVTPTNTESPSRNFFRHIKKEKSTTPEEAALLVTLVDMGFKGDLLSVLRKNKGDLMNTLGELVGREN